MVREQGFRLSGRKTTVPSANPAIPDASKARFVVLTENLIEYPAARLGNYMLMVVEFCQL